uniref:Putative secreted protein n=1 Tax=Ixodes ricinus TaxID=34613 RepID=A0A6B0ULM2_IXORI
MLTFMYIHTLSTSLGLPMHCTYARKASFPSLWRYQKHTIYRHSQGAMLSECRPTHCSPLCIYTLSTSLGLPMHCTYARKASFPSLWRYQKHTIYRHSQGAMLSECRPTAHWKSFLS